MFFESWSALIRVIVVGALGYAALIVLLRASGKRTLSKMNAFDLVVTVALGSTFASMLLSKDVVLADGVVALALLVFLQFVITWSSVRWKAFDRALKAEPSLLYYDGHMMEATMQRERVSKVELEAAVRQHGYGGLEQIRAVVLETDGSMSVIARDRDGDIVRALAAAHAHCSTLR